MAKANIEDIVKQLQDKNADHKNRYQQLTDQEVTIKAMDAIQQALIRSVSAVITSMMDGSQKAEITNMPTIKLDKDSEVHVELAPLQKRIDALLGAVKKLPTSYPSHPEMPRTMAVSNLGEVSKELQALSKDIKRINVNPIVNVDTPEVKVDLSKELKAIEKAVKSINGGSNDNKDLKKAVKEVEKAVKSIEIPVPNFRSQEIVTAIENITVPAPEGGATEDKQDTQLEQLKRIRGFDIPEYDEIELGYTGDDLTSVVYKQATATVATLSLTYTSGNLTNVSIS